MCPTLLDTPEATYHMCIYIYIYIVVDLLTYVQLFAALWSVAHQAPLSMGFPRQEYWSGLPLSSPGDLPNPGIEPTSPALAGGFFTTEPPWKPIYMYEKM